MFNELSHDEMAAMMLSTQLGPTDRPLERSVYYHIYDLAQEMHDSLASLLDRDNAPALQLIERANLPHQSVARRLDAGFAMALAMDNWSRRGIHVVSHMSEHYPKELHSLGPAAPPFLWIAGDPDLQHAAQKQRAIRPITSSLLTLALNRRVRNALLAGKLTLVGVSSPFQQKPKQVDFRASARMQQIYS